MSHEHQSPTTDTRITDDPSEEVHPPPIEGSITDSLIDEIADAATAAKVTIYRRLLGLPIRGRRLANRVDREIAARGFRPGGTR